MGTAATRRTALILGGGIVSILLLGVLGDRLLSSRTVTSTPGDLDQAVAIGVLDQRVVDELGANGVTTAIVHLDTAPIVARIKAEFGDAAVAAWIGRARAIWAEQKDAILRETGSGVALVTDYVHLGAAEVSFTSEAALLAVVQNPFVRRVSEVVAVDLSPVELAEAPRTYVPPTFDFAGTGVAVGVIDTGLDAARYPEYFEGASVTTREAEGAQDGEADDGGHGTHVSSIIHMVAPDASLYVIDTFKWGIYDGERDLRSPYTIAGVDWMVDLLESGVNLKAVNLSLGSGHYTSVCADDFHFGELDAWGAIPVVSSGNEAYTRNAAGQPVEPYLPGIGRPACISNALSVGNLSTGSCPGNDMDAANEVWKTSQSSPQLKILAPGHCIEAAGGRAGEYAGMGGPSLQMTGTSMAAPHVAGAVAILWSAGATSQSQVRDALENSGARITDQHSQVTVGKLDIPRALARLEDPSTPLPRTPAFVVASTSADTSAQLGPGDEGVVGSFALEDTSGQSTPVTFTIQPSGFVLSADAPADWFSISPPQANVAPFGRLFVTVRAHVPDGAASGPYAALVQPEFEDGTSAGDGVVVTFDVAEGSAGEPDDDTWILIGLIGIGLAFGAWKLLQRKPAQPAA